MLHDAEWWAHYIPDDDAPRGGDGDGVLRIDATKMSAEQLTRAAFGG